VRELPLERDDEQKHADDSREAERHALEHGHRPGLERQRLEEEDRLEPSR
jgi:hypothetical protein